MFYATAYSIFNVPYMAMPGEMTRTYHERTTLMSWRSMQSGWQSCWRRSAVRSCWICSAAAAAAYADMSFVFAPIVVGAGLIAFSGTANAPATARAAARPGLRALLVSGFSNRPFVVLMLVKFVTLMSLGIQAIFPFFFQRILGAPNSVLGLYFLCQSLMMIATPAVWSVLSGRVGKRATFLIALAISLPVWLSWLVAHHGEAVWMIYLRGLVLGASGAGVILMGQSMLPDTMDYDYRRTGLRREGVFAALYTTVEKLSGAIGVALVGAILGAYGYVASRGATIQQPASALWAIRATMAWIPTLITLAGMAALLGYNLDERKLASTTRIS